MSTAPPPVSGNEGASTDTHSRAPEAQSAPTPEERRALFRVVRGEPSDAELAALTVVLAAAASGGGDTPPTPRGRWSDRAAAMRVPLMAGPGAWRTSHWPH